ncbi:MAG: 1-acyl-sn-glycerol-3-phosphate acyltransferase [Vampirovibrionales bacterium]|nr:1-acyl-sn-glycerol-3-phosphate acyltransferase [Vampirovibrionales bacterium]
MSKTAFRPPKLTPMVVNTVKTLLPWMMGLPSFAIKTVFEPQDIQTLKQYQGQRLLLLPNHPSSEDPLILMDLSRHVGAMFNYVAAREVFELYHGVNGWLLQHCGVYSVIRGKADRESFKTTRGLLAKGERPLVVFIEGEVSSENETLIPFEGGVLQLAFWALEDIKKEDIKKEGIKPHSPHANPSETTLPPLNAALVALKYFYDDGVLPVVDRALSHLEKATGLEDRSGQDAYLRFQALGAVVLSVHEKALNISAKETDTITRRVERVKERLLGQMERYLDLFPQEEQSYLERIRAARNRIDVLVYSYEDTDEFSDYERHSLEMRQKTFSGFYQHLGSLVNFLTFQEGRVIGRSSLHAPEAEDVESFDDVESQREYQPERLMELVHRLEKEILGQVVTHHPRTAVVKLGKIHNLSDYYPAYLGDKKKTVLDLTDELEAEMGGYLREIQKPR